MRPEAPTTSRRSCWRSMLRNLTRLSRYRGLIQSLVARELKARYRGSVLGFFWSFINPLLLLLVYSFVFSFIMPAAHDSRIEPYALFMFCGILPWTWFSSSLTESAGVLISGGNLIKKVLFPAEILPIVTVLANMIHFFFGLVILAGFLIWYRRPLHVTELALFPIAVFVQLVLTGGFALILSALTVHFRDIRDILSNLLTFWFFATPIIYPYFLFPQNEWKGQVLKLNPFTHLAITYQEILFFEGPVGHLKWLLLLGVISLAFFLFGYWIFDRLRDTFAEEV
jgi:lipopolysaccharide transport system permease protein